MKPTRRPTKSIFKEYNENGTEELADWKTRFVAISDPTEYLGALDLAGSWEEWQRFKREWPEFGNKILIDWLAEVEVKIRSESIRNLIDQSLDPKGSAASKWLAEGKYKPRQAGRPSNAEITKQAKIQSRIDDEVSEDIARVSEVVGLKLVR